MLSPDLIPYVAHRIFQVAKVLDLAPQEILESFPEHFLTSEELLNLETYLTNMENS